jgi:hypothetical protein
MWWTRSGSIVLTVLLATPGVQGAARVTHKQAQAIKVEGTGGGTLQSMVRTTDGRIAALVGASRYGGIRGDAKSAPDTEVHVFDKDGTELASWKVEFPGQSIGAGPAGAILVGGNGKIAKYDAAGKLLQQTELPHIAAILADKEGLRQRARELLNSQKKALANSRRATAAQIKSLKTRIARLEEAEQAAADETDEEGKPKLKSARFSAADKRRLERYKEQLATYEERESSEEDSEEAEGQVDDAQLQSFIEQVVQQAALISGISATDEDVFIVCREQKGYGFAAWRMDHDFQNPVKILSELRGCCGQMDVQAIGTQLYVAENTKHRVGHYDRNGKPVEEFGTTAGPKNTEGFGGCCNPMNLCFGPDGDVLTAESEGIIRRFSSDGEYLGLVGRVKLTGGCKNVAVAASPKGDRVYFCDLPGSRIIVLAPVAEEDDAEALAKPPKPKPGAPIESDE